MPKKKLSDLKFICLKRKLLITKAVVRIFGKYAQRSRTSERGGILLGYAFEDHDEIVKVTIPNRYDSSGLFFFNRARKPAQLEINKSWKQTKGTLIYLGEWHTHSVLIPVPSGDDKIMISKNFKETKMEIDYLYLIIVGLNSTFWIGRQTESGLVKLRQEN